MAKYDYSELDNHFEVEIGLDQSKEQAAKAGALLAMLPYEESQQERAAHCHTIAQCLYEYIEVLKAIKAKGGAV